MVRLRSAAESTFGGLPGAFWWLWIATLVNRLGGFVLPFFAFYITGPLHRSAVFAGAVAALFGAGAAVSGVVGGVLTDRIGRKPTLIGSQLANAATIVVLGYARSTWALALGALAVGLATSAFRPAQNAMIADMVPAGDRVRAYALNFWAINLGFSFSMAVVGLVTHFGYRTLFYADAATTTLCALLIAILVPDTTPVETIRARARSSSVAVGDGRKREGLGTVLRDRTFIAFVATTFVLLIVFCQYNSGLPMAMSASGLSAATFGRIAAINGVLIVLLQMPVTRLLKRYPEGRVLAGAGLVIGGGFGLLAFGQSIEMYVLCVVVTTLGEIGNTPTGQAITARLAADHLRGRYQGVYQLAWTLSQVAAPLVGGAVLSAYGGAPLWIGCFAVTGLTALVFLRIGKHVERRVAAARSAEAEAEADQTKVTATAIADGQQPELATA
ncbi:MFS transporter [Actinocrinis sp.]|uniref:MDR family MFS transporter n=1 Tax=Actinocrinis sp. TaxID=1920516 RepID=UPI002BE0A392|nr:MFS transporter [Actinocrinis sp.]HXR72203.1 MFS transporter [Actinocrinis sp.]